MTNLRSLLDRYVAALNSGAEAAADPLERFDYAQALAAARRMQAAIDARDLGRLAAELHEETRTSSWTHLPGEHGAAIHDRLHRLNDAVLRARLEGRPSAW